jgi:cellobiose dehydrogenase (acceptor)
MGQIILSAGALGTPKLLYFSGIGPSDILTQLNNSAQLSMPRNNWIVNENVGRGLYDNPNTFIMLQSPDVESYAFGYTSPGQTGVFWDIVTGSDGRKVGVYLRIEVLLIS